MTDIKDGMTESMTETPSAQPPFDFVSPATALPLSPAYLRPVDPVVAMFRILDSGRDGAVPVVQLVDEELSVLMDSDRHRGGFPYLSKLEPGARKQAKETAARLLLARRLVHPTATGANGPTRTQATAELQGTITAIRSAPRTVRAHRVGAEHSDTLVQYQFPAQDRVLEEYIAADGMHVFLVSPLAEAAGRLAGFVDPFGTSQGTETSETRRVNMAEVIRGNESMGDVEENSKIVTVIDGIDISRWFPAGGITHDYRPGDMHRHVRDTYLRADRTVPGYSERRLTVYVSDSAVTCAEAAFDGPILRLREVSAEKLLAATTQFTMDDFALPEPVLTQVLEENSRSPRMFVHEAGLRNPDAFLRNPGAPQSTDTASSEETPDPTPEAPATSEEARPAEAPRNAEARGASAAPAPGTPGRGFTIPPRPAHGPAPAERTERY